jgi:hypothetical protein
MLCLCVIGVVLAPRYLSTLRAQNAQPYPPYLPAAANYDQRTPEQEQWALATDGVLTELNHERHDILESCDLTPDNVRIAKDGLAQWWDIRSRSQLLDTLSWIENGGHRREFDRLVKVVSSASPAQLQAMRSQVRNDPEASNQLDIAIKYGSVFGSKSITGWDYGRYVFLCRRGYLVGYLTRDEAWQKIMPAARLLQSTFSSWDDLGENYALGRQFWSLQESQSGGAEVVQARQHLLSDPSSPWVRLPWDLDLVPASSK